MRRCALQSLQEDTTIILPEHAAGVRRLRAGTLCAPSPVRRDGSEQGSGPVWVAPPGATARVPINNAGLGDCARLAAGHGLGHIPLEQEQSQQVEEEVRLTLADGMVATVTNGRFPTLQALVTATGDARLCTESQHRLYFKRASALDMMARAGDVAAGLVVYSANWLDRFQEVVQYESGAQRSSPVTIWAVVARVYHVTVAL